VHRQHLTKQINKHPPRTAVRLIPAPPHFQHEVGEVG